MGFAKNPMFLLRGLYTQPAPDASSMLVWCRLASVSFKFTALQTQNSLAASDAVWAWCMASGALPAWQRRHITGLHSSCWSARGTCVTRQPA